ncbi:MAG: hypothetical protein GTN59_11165 [Candidatus Dadabacteria bacterium]|nr:hypothetical protein [Candidatus Dadabacteria bacterium]
MIKNITLTHDYAVSEVVGGIILVIIAVLSFVVINLYAFPDLDSPDSKIDVIGYVNDNGVVVFEHVGGKSIISYKVEAYQINGTFIDSKEYRSLETPWSIGKCIYPLKDINCPLLHNESDKVKIVLFTYNEDGEEQEIFRGILEGHYVEPPGDIPILITSLKTNTPDEDIICFSYPIIPDINATTYIYKWLVNGNPFAQLIMPFNTADNSTTKDYSGYGNHANVIGPNWISQGKVGGAYYFDGSSEYITLSLPSVFYDIPNNDFTICLWSKSDNASVDNSIALMASENTQNFVKMFQFGGEIHFGVSSEGTKRAVRSENLSSNTWYHIAAVWSASEKKLLVYIDGIEHSETGYRQFALGSGAGLLELGHGTASSKFWKGYMDELEIYDRVLTKEQIYQIYLSTKNGSYDRRTIISSLITIGDRWQCIVIPNDGDKDGILVESNVLKISNYGGGE